MNPPHDPYDPNDLLRQSLADEAADLPLRAAREARSRNMHYMRQRYRAASAVTILFVCVCSLSVITTSEHRTASFAVQHAASEADPEKPTASTEPIPPIIAPKAPERPDLYPTPLIASSKPALPPRPNTPHPAPAASPAPRPLTPFETSAPDPSDTLPGEFVKMQNAEEAMRHPLPLPEGLDREQQELFKAARGLPLLLVRDNAGKVLRIHVIER